MCHRSLFHPQINTLGHFCFGFTKLYRALDWWSFSCPQHMALKVTLLSVNQDRGKQHIVLGVEFFSHFICYIELQGK